MVSEDSDDQPLAKRYKRSTARPRNRSRNAQEKPDTQTPARKYFGPSRRRIVHDDSDDEVSVKTIPSRRRINHDIKITEPQSTSLDPNNPSETPPAMKPTTTPGIQDASIPHTNSKHGSRGSFCGHGGSEDTSPRIASVTDHVHIQERLLTLEAENYRYQAEKRQDRERVLELEEQISLLKEQQDRKLEQGLRELKRQMNYSINQSIMMQRQGRGDE